MIRLSQARREPLLFQAKSWQGEILETVYEALRGFNQLDKIRRESDFRYEL